MAEEIVAPAPAAAQPAQEANPFSDNSWASAPAEPAPAPEGAPASEGQPAAAAPVAEPAKPEPKIVDVNDWLKETFEVDSVEVAKQKWAEFKKLQEQPPAGEHTFANDESKKFYEAITKGDRKTVYNMLHQQEQLERLESLQLTSAKEAAEIIKTNLQFKHKDLTQPEIERIFNRQYAMPPQPKQGADQEDTEYALVLEDWKAQVAGKEQDMIIDAKLAKPELSQYKSQLVLPDIPKVEPGQPQPDQKVLAEEEASRNNFIQHLERDYNKFAGFNVTAKDGEVELPINYVITPEELAQSKQMVQDFNVNEFLDKRWFDEKGNPNVTLIQEDLYLLTNRNKVFQKIANESAAKRLDHHLKTKSNVKIDGQPSSTFMPNGEKTAKEQEEAVIWGA